MLKIITTIRYFYNDSRVLNRTFIYKPQLITLSDAIKAYFSIAQEKVDSIDRPLRLYLELTILIVVFSRSTTRTEVELYTIGAIDTNLLPIILQNLTSKATRQLLDIEYRFSYSKQPQGDVGNDTIKRSASKSKQKQRSTPPPLSDVTKIISDDTLKPQRKTVNEKNREDQNNQLGLYERIKEHY